jgi:hypothetical protein
LLYLFLIIKAIYWLCYYDLFFGKNAIAYTQPHSLGAIKNQAFLLYSDAESDFGYFFVISLLVCVGLSFFLKNIPFIFEFIIWLLVINIQNKIYPTLTGGDLLLNQFLFFNCFFAKTYSTDQVWKNSLFVALHNFAVVAILIQICLVYLIAGLAKLNSADWLGGNAVNNLSFVTHFNLFSGPIIKNELLNSGINYIILFYQLLFPFLIWMNKLKKPMVLLGLATHLYIAFVTGLLGFGLIMTIPYIFFWPLKKQIA